MGWKRHPYPSEEPQAAWSGFFLFLSAATFLGAIKHGIPHYLPGISLSLVVFGSSLATGLGVLHAEAAAAQTHLQRQRHSLWVRRLAQGKFAVYLLLITLTSSFVVVILNTALGLGPVIMAEYSAFRRGDRSAGWVVGGLAVSWVGAAAYLFEVPNHPWFEHRDLAHVLMMVTLLMMYRGIQGQGRKTTAKTP